MNEELLKIILQTYGPLGAVLIFAGWALNKLYTQIAEVQEKRVNDSQASLAKVLALVEAHHKQISVLATAIDGSTDANRDLREANQKQLEDLREALAALRIELGRAPPRRG